MSPEGFPEEVAVKYGLEEQAVVVPMKEEEFEGNRGLTAEWP